MQKSGFQTSQKKNMLKIVYSKIVYILNFTKIGGGVFEKITFEVKS